VVRREARGKNTRLIASAFSVATPADASACAAVRKNGAVCSRETAQVDGACNVSELAVLDLVGRHAFISSAVLGQVLGRDGRWVAARRRSLARRGLMRLVSKPETGLDGNASGDHLELTGRGLRVLAAQLGVPLQRAVTLLGVAGGGPHTPIGSRHLLLRHLLHTIGADDFFGHLAEVAREDGLGELIEWRNAAASAHGRVRPDGYGLLRIGQREYGFFLEYDRGTVRTTSLRAKFAAYDRYRMSARAEREYDGFPDILVVTAGGAEDRITDAIASVACGSTWHPRTFVTTVALLRVTRAGPLGPIWRVPGPTARRVSWPVTSS
jgi:hypothetical protein